jgi:hypothetical protein
MRHLEALGYALKNKAPLNTNKGLHYLPVDEPIPRSGCRPLDWFRSPAAAGSIKGRHGLLPDAAGFGVDNGTWVLLGWGPTTSQIAPKDCTEPPCRVSCFRMLVRLLDAMHPEPEKPRRMGTPLWRGLTLICGKPGAKGIPLPVPAHNAQPRSARNNVDLLTGRPRRLY